MKTKRIRMMKMALLQTSQVMNHLRSKTKVKIILNMKLGQSHVIARMKIPKTLKKMMIFSRNTCLVDIASCRRMLK